MSNLPIYTAKYVQILRPTSNLILRPLSDLRPGAVALPCPSLVLPLGRVAVNAGVVSSVGGRMGERMSQGKSSGRDDILMLSRKS